MERINCAIHNMVMVLLGCHLHNSFLRYSRSQKVDIWQVFLMQDFCGVMAWIRHNHHGETWYQRANNR